MPIEMTVKISGSAADRTLTFSESPVRVGRNQLNDIAIDDPFISQWHGLIRFGEDGITYSDLGSTNGSIIEGVRLSTNVPNQLTDRSCILLGRIELAVSMRSRELTGPRMTIGWGQQRPAGSGRGSSESLSPRPADARRSSGPQPAQGAPVSPSGEVPSPRQQQILEAFGEAFVGLRKGYEQFGVEVGVRTINGRTALHRARTAQAVLDYLLQQEAPVAAVKRDLIGIFADFGIHHIAMMAAVTEGVRALLQSLDPRVNDLDAGGGLFSGSRAKSKWNAYLERFDQILTDDKELHAAIFGPEFARAYARATLGDGSKTDKPGDE
jgi:predicted component of type VI protein secretion system